MISDVEAYPDKISLTVSFVLLLLLLFFIFRSVIAVKCIYFWYFLLQLCECWSVCELFFTPFIVTVQWNLTKPQGVGHISRENQKKKIKGKKINSSLYKELVYSLFFFSFDSLSEIWPGHAVLLTESQYKKQQNHSHISTFIFPAYVRSNVFSSVTVHLE